MKFLMLAGSALVALASARGAQAQSQAPSSDVGQESPARQTPEAERTTPASDTAQTADIVVTAQKRSERLQDVPASVSVVTATDLTKQGVVRFSDYATRVPGLSLTSVRTGQTQVTLRGITTGATQSASSTGYYVDEAPIGSINAYTGGSLTTPDLDPSDLAQIEVLKGPQGTLYGAGAVGGLLKFETAAPDLENIGGRLSAGINGADHGGLGYSVRGVINVPLVTDQLGLHFSGFHRQDPGYIDNVNTLAGRKDVNRSRVSGGRGVLAMRLGPDVRVDLSAILQDTHTGGLNVEDVDAATLQPLYGNLAQSRPDLERGFVQFRLYNLTAHVDLGRVNIVSSTTYQHTAVRQDTDGTQSFGVALGAAFRIPGLGILQHQRTYTERWSEELRASADKLAGGLLDLQAGFYYTHENDQNRVPGFDPFLTSTGAALALPSIISAAILTSYNEYSFFGNGTLHLGSKFDVLGGVRYSHDDQDYYQDYSGLLVGARRINTGSETRGIVTYLASPRFRFSDNAMVYARVASGYRPGGPNAVPPTTVAAAPNTFAPDRLTQYEVGFKGTLFDRLLTVDAAAFYTDWNDIQIQTSAGGFNFFVNGGSARSKGGEVTVRVTPVKALNLGLNASYTDARLTTAAPAAGGLGGDRLPYVPHFSGSLTGDYTASLGGDWRAVLGATAGYMGSRFSDYSQRFAKRLPSFTTVDLRAGVERGNFSLSAFAKNVGDSRGLLVLAAQGLAPSNTPGAPYSASVIQPRTIGAEAAIRF